jgi:undecaprenyl-diphosphatase
LNIIEAIVLNSSRSDGFLPISSTGHLTLAGKLMNLISTDHPEQWTSFIAVIQLGTLLAVLVYFWKDLINITKDFVHDNLIKPVKYSEQKINSKLGWLIIIGTIPVVIIGLTFKDAIEGALTKNLFVIATSLIVLALILALAEKIAKFRKGVEDITILDSIIIGIAQALSLIPGSSRSGTTITAGLFVGLNREAAARFSLKYPAFKWSITTRALKFIDPNMAVNIIVSTIVSGISGYLAIDFLLKYLKKNTTFIFIYYRIALGIFILILLLTNIIQP